MLCRPQIANYLSGPIRMDPNTSPTISWSRVAGVAFGIGTHILFAATVYSLFIFLHDGSSHSGGKWLLFDSFLWLQFAVAHSFVLLPSTRSAISRIIQSQFYGCIVCV